MKTRRFVLSLPVLNRERSMKKKHSVVVVALLVLSSSTAFSSDYQGYIDGLTASPWYDGVVAGIEYINTTVGGTGISAWCGIDNSNSADWMWIQCGWKKQAGWSEGTVYWEYNDDTSGGSSQGWVGTPSTSAIYKAWRNGANAQWVAGGTVIKTRPWTDFDGKNFCRAYYGAEIHNSPADYTPGGVSDPCDFTSIQLRTAGGSFTTASCANIRDQATNGRTSAATSGNFYIWDIRTP